MFIKFKIIFQNFNFHCLANCFFIFLVQFFLIDFDFLFANHYYLKLIIEADCYEFNILKKAFGFQFKLKKINFQDFEIIHIVNLFFNEDFLCCDLQIFFHREVTDSLF